MKAREYECPNCGEFEEVFNNGKLDDINITERNGEMYEYIAIVRKCHKCGATWTEYMRLVYDGYFDGNKVYLPNGEVERK